MPPFELLVPRTETEAVEELAHAEPGAVAVLAGGTDLLLDLDDGRLVARRLISLRRLPWNRHGWSAGALEVGSTEPLAALESDPSIAERLPALADAIAAVGSRALRHQATLGGNLGRAAPASDLAPVLLALDAEVDVLGPSGSRRVPVDAFLKGSRQTALASGELIRSVRFPEARPVSAYLWQRVRPANDISQIGIAVAHSVADGRWRVSLGGVPPRSVLATVAAEALAGLPPTSEAIDAAAARLAEHPALVSDRRATDEHRRRLAAVLCVRAVRQALEAGEGRR